VSGLTRGEPPDDRDSTGAAAPGDASGPPADPGRRTFFRSFSREAIQAAAQIVGAATALQRSSLAATGQLLGVDTGNAPAADPLARFLGLEDPAPPPPQSQLRSPYRHRDGELVLIDQRRLPEELVEVTCHTGAEVAACIRDWLVRGGPVLGQVAAYGLLVAAERTRNAGEFIRAATLHGTINALRSSRPTSRSIEVSMDRMLASWLAVGEHADGDLVANVLRAEAEAIAEESMLDLAALGRWGAATLPVPAERRLEVLLHGPVGAFAGGTLGTALAVVLELQVQGRQVHAWLPEGRPSLQGARITAFELGRLEIPHTLIADAAAAGLIARGSVDAVLVGAERIARNGDVSATVGTYPLAAVAVRHGVPFYVCAPLATLDPRVGDGWGFMAEDGPVDELSEVRGRPVAPPASQAYSPLLDVTPASLVRGFITEVGVLEPPFEETLTAAGAAAAERRERRSAAEVPDPQVATVDGLPPEVAPPAADGSPSVPAPAPGPAGEDEDGWGEGAGAGPGGAAATGPTW
jgi:methylthioribose-1-phosphate isomerase